MSSAASDEETEELMAALGDDSDDEEEGGEVEPAEELLSQDEDEDDELHIAARAGIRLLEENMHFREEVLRLHEQLEHLEDEKKAVERTLADRDAQVAALSGHLRDAILENQGLFSELSQSKDQLRAAQHEIVTLQQQQLQQQPRSPRRRPSQRQSPRRSSMLSRSLVFDEVDGAEEAVRSPRSEPRSPASVTSPTPVSSDEIASTISPVKAAIQQSETATERRQSVDEVLSSPRRRPTLARLREIEAKYDEEHQRCTSLKLELNFAQRRVSELKPLQTLLEEAYQEREAAKARIASLEKQIQQAHNERVEEQELIQSLRQTVQAYEELNDPRRRGSSLDYDRRLGHPLQDGEVSTAEGLIANESSDQQSFKHNQQLERLDRAAEMIDGRFNMREENERLLQQLNNLTERVLTLTTSVLEKEESTDAAATKQQSSLTRQRYLEQQVSVLQDLLRRFRLEWQHAHDARVCLEDEKAELLKQLDRQQAKLQRTRSTSVVSSRRASADLQHALDDPVKSELETLKSQPDLGDPAEDDDDDDGDGDAAHERRLWERTNAICQALLRPSPSASKDEDAENELLCFALLRRLVDSWTTDKPKRMVLHDWLTNAIRQTGVRRPLYLQELSSEVAMGFQTLMVPILKDKFGVYVHVEKRLRNVIVTDLRIQVLEPDLSSTPLSPSSVGRVQRVYHSLLSVIDGENGVQGGDEYQDWLGNYSARRASRGFLAK